MCDGLSGGLWACRGGGGVTKGGGVAPGALNEWQYPATLIKIDMIATHLFCLPSPPHRLVAKLNLPMTHKVTGSVFPY